MKENYMHYAKDTKEYFPRRRGSGIGGGAFRGPPPAGIGGGGAFRGAPGGGYGAGGYPWGAHGYGNRFRYNYPVGYRYPIGYNYPAFPSLCTEINKDPFATSVQIECCPGLTQCLADWNNDNNPYYLCKKSCDE